MRVISLMGLVFVLVLGGGMKTACAAEETADPAAALFNSQLRAHFEDIHEVSMRFHMNDPSIGGRIALDMSWEDGRLDSAQVVENQTGNDAEAGALIDAMRRWTIEGIFVRTLIPPGVWDLTIHDSGHQPVTVEALELETGQHRIEHVVLGTDVTVGKGRD